MRAIAAIALLVSLAGCEGSPFPPRTLVERLRILDVAADPPEVGLDGEVALTALVANPQDPAAELQFTWAVCLIQIGAAAKEIACPGPDSFPLEGDGASSVLRIPDLVTWLAGKGLPIDPTAVPPKDLPASLPVFVGFEVRSATESTRGLKHVVVRLREVETEQPNANPALLGLLLDGAEVGADPRTLAASSKATLRPVADETTRQLYRREGETGADPERLEDFVFAWYSTGGEFGQRFTILDVDIHGNRLDENDWTLPPDPGEVTLWLIVRDGRYGTDWLERRFRIE